MAPTRSRSIAVLLAGELRGFLSLTVQASVRRHALEAMSSAATTTSLFVVLKLTAGELASQRAQVLHALRRLNASRYQLISAPPSPHAACASLVRHWPGALFDHFQAAWRDLAQGFAMIRRYETSERQGNRFDWIVKLRADEQLCSPLPTLDAIGQYILNMSKQSTSPGLASPVIHQWQPLPRCEHAGARRRLCHSTDDHLAIVPRIAADRFFSAEQEAGASCHAADYAPFCAWPAGQMEAVGDVPSECLLGRWLSTGGILVDRGGLLGLRTACMWANQTAVRGGCQCPQPFS